MGPYGHLPSLPVRGREGGWAGNPLRCRSPRVGEEGEPWSSAWLFKNRGF